MSTASTPSTMLRKTASCSLRCAVMSRMRSSSCAAIWLITTARPPISAVDGTYSRWSSSPAARRSTPRFISSIGRAMRPETARQTMAAATAISTPTRAIWTCRSRTAWSMWLSDMAVRRTSRFPRGSCAAMAAYIMVAPIVGLSRTARPTLPGRGEGLLNLGPAGVVFHPRGSRVGVAEHGSVRLDHGDARVGDLAHLFAEGVYLRRGRGQQAVGHVAAEDAHAGFEDAARSARGRSRAWPPRRRA